MHGSYRSVRLTGVSPENKGMNALSPITSTRAWVSRSNREEESRDPRKSFDISRRRTNPGKMFGDDKKSMGDEQRRDKSLGMDSKREGLGESKGGIRGTHTSESAYPP